MLRAGETVPIILEKRFGSMKEVNGEEVRRNSRKRER